MKIIKVAIIGQGRSGWKIHGDYFVNQSDMYKVVAIVDKIKDRRDKVEQRYGKDVAVYEDYTELFKRDDIDLVVNSTYSHMHLPVSLDLMNHGYNVLSEKPVAKSPEEIDLLEEASKKNNVGFYMFQQSRCASNFQEIKRIIASGKLGRIISINILYSGFSRRWDWQTIQGMNAGSLLNTGPHPVDQAVDLYGEGMPNVRCIMDRVNTYGDAEDFVKLLLWGEDKPVIEIEISACQNYNPYNYNIQGSKGSLIADQESITYKYFDEKTAPEQKLIKEPLTAADGEPSYCSEELEWHEEKWEMKKEVYGTFADRTSNYYKMLYNHIVNNEEMIVKISEVRTQMAIIQEAHKQNPLKKFVKV